MVRARRASAIAPIERSQAGRVRFGRPTLFPGLRAGVFGNPPQVAPRFPSRPGTKVATLRKVRETETTQIHAQGSRIAAGGTACVHEK